MPAFERTRKAAHKEKTSKWDLIAAIAEDAVEYGLPITGAQSQADAKRAMAIAGLEYADSTIEQLTVTAKFDYESTPAQRELWRRYGWTIVKQFARSSWTQEAAFEALKSGVATKRQVEALLRAPGTVAAPLPLPELWATYLAAQSKAFRLGAEAAERSEKEDLDPQSNAAYLIYQRITERQIDAELRNLMESEVV